jgi:peptidoglycan-associated lipoprotein
VDTSGSRQVTPSDSITYHLIAKGAGGTQDATARVTVNAPPPPPPPPP